MVITTNEARYRVGEPVTITVKNRGDQALTFPNSAVGLKIQSMNTGQVYSVAATQLTTELEPGASRMLLGIKRMATATMFQLVITLLLCMAYRLYLHLKMSQHKLASKLQNKYGYADDCSP